MEQSPNTGLEKISKDLVRLSHGRLQKTLSPVIAPEKQLMVMIVGNHSAGKSSFINWYVGEDIQKAKVSIETIEVNMIMHGKRREEFNGYNALKLLPFLKDLVDPRSKTERYPGLLENLVLKSSTSRERDFENVIFVDTPGLADGNLRYKFDIEKVLEWFADRSDMVMVFFDPQGQALCKRTMNLVKHLYSKSQNKLNFVMTKGDIFESD